MNQPRISPDPKMLNPTVHDIRDVLQFLSVQGRGHQNIFTFEGADTVYTLDTENVVLVDTDTERTVRLPQSIGSSVSDGGVGVCNVMIKDVTGTANEHPIKVSVINSDLEEGRKEIYMIHRPYGALEFSYVDGKWIRKNQHSRYGHRRFKTIAKADPYIDTRVNTVSGKNALVIDQRVLEGGHLNIVDGSSATTV